MAVSIALRNENNFDQSCTVITKLINAAGKEAGRAESKAATSSGQALTLEQMIPIDKPVLWSVEQPALY